MLNDNYVGTEIFTQVYNQIKLRYGVDTPSTRLNYCSAWHDTYLATDPETGELITVAALQSYGTLAAVAVRYPDHVCVFRFLHHSATTCQHVHKFGKLYANKWFGSPYRYTITDLSTDKVNRRIYQRCNL